MAARRWGRRGRALCTCRPHNRDHEILAALPVSVRTNSARTRVRPSTMRVAPYGRCVPRSVQIQSAAFRLSRGAVSRFCIGLTAGPRGGKRDDRNYPRENVSSRRSETFDLANEMGDNFIRAAIRALRLTTSSSLTLEFDDESCRYSVTR